MDFYWQNRPYALHHYGIGGRLWQVCPICGTDKSLNPYARHDGAAHDSFHAWELAQGKNWTKAWVAMGPQGN